MPTPNLYTKRYVNQMLNIAYLTGVVRRPQLGKGFFLDMRNSPTSEIEILVKSDSLVPVVDAPVTVTCHIRGVSSDDSDPISTHACHLHCIEVKPASTRAMPTIEAWLAKHRSAENRALSNDASLCGFVESFTHLTSITEPVGKALLLLRQHADSSRSIPVQIFSKNIAAIGRSIAIGEAVTVHGKVVKIIDDDHTTMRVHTNDLYRPTLGDMLCRPEWASSGKEQIAA